MSSRRNSVRTALSILLLQSLPCLAQGHMAPPMMHSSGNFQPTGASSSSTTTQRSQQHSNSQPTVHGSNHSGNTQGQTNGAGSSSATNSPSTGDAQSGSAGGASAHSGNSVAGSSSGTGGHGWTGGTNDTSSHGGNGTTVHGGIGASAGHGANSSQTASSNNGGATQGGHNHSHWTGMSLTSVESNYTNVPAHFWTGAGASLNSLNAGSAHQVNLNLSSTTAGSSDRALGNRTVGITVGNTQLAVTSQTALTSAERAAVNQVLHTGTQSLLLNSQGAADGGALTLNSGTASHLSTLVIPQGVTVTDVSRTGSLKVSGSLTDLGNLDVTTKNSAVNTFSILAGNISVGSTGSISTVIPSTSLLQFSPPNTLGLSLISQKDISNSGTITSAGALNLTAGGAIKNLSSADPSGVGQALLKATDSVSLTSGGGNITNTGLVLSSTGAINLGTKSPTTDLVVTAGGGTFQASNGNINVRNGSYVGAANETLNGGNYLSQNLNLNAGTGAILGYLGNVTGQLNSTGDQAHIYANGPNLALGDNKISGDPTFANIGNITVSGTNTFSESVSVVAGGNITGDSTGSIATTAPGQPIILISGATLSFQGGASAAPPGGTITGSPTGISTGDVAITFTNVNGGNINFTAFTGGGPVLQTAGSSVTLLANSNGAGTGNILFNSSGSSISTSNSPSQGGNVLVAAGGSGGAIQLGSVTTNGGNVQISTAAPVITNGGGTAFFNPDGSATTTAGGGTGSTFGAAGSLTPGASISVQSVDTSGGTVPPPGANGLNGGNISIQSSGNISGGSLLSFGGGGGGGFASDIGPGNPGGAGGTGGNVSLSGSTVNVSGDINASGGGGGGGGAGFGSSAGGAGGASGIVSTAGTLTLTGSIFQVAGGAGGAGNGSSVQVGGGGGGGGAIGGAGGGGGGLPAGQMGSPAGTGGAGGITDTGLNGQNGFAAGAIITPPPPGVPMLPPIAVPTAQAPIILSGGQTAPTLSLPPAPVTNVAPTVVFPIVTPSNTSLSDPTPAIIATDQTPTGNITPVSPTTGTPASSNSPETDISNDTNDTTVVVDGSVQIAAVVPVVIPTPTPTPTPTSISTSTPTPSMIQTVLNEDSAILAPTTAIMVLPTKGGASQGTAAPSTNANSTSSSTAPKKLYCN